MTDFSASNGFHLIRKESIVVNTWKYTLHFYKKKIGLDHREYTLQITDEDGNEAAIHRASTMDNLSQWANSGIISSIVPINGNQ